MSGIAGEHLKAFVDRIERLEEEKAAIGDDIKAVYAEAKSTGYDVATIRKIVKLRKISEADRQEQDELLDLYMSALGMLKGTPLGDYMAREFAEKKEGRAEDHGLESDVAQAEDQIGAEAEQTQGEAAAGSIAETEAANPNADWGDDHLDQKEGDDGATAGFAYREGERAAREGIAIKELLKAHNKHHLCAWAKSAKAGYEAELKRQAREQQAEESAGLDVAPLNVVSMVPLPKLTDGVATSSGDAA